MRKLLLVFVVGTLLALPGASFGKAKHVARGHKRAHATKKIKSSKRGRMAVKKHDLVPTSTVDGMELSAAPEPKPEPAPAPMAAPIEGHKVQAVTPHEASNMATQMADDETPGKKR